MNNYRTGRFKASTFSIILTTALLIPAASLYSESFFLKDGSISEGNIISEDDNTITIQGNSGGTINIARHELIRVLVHKRYKDKKYITTTSGVTILGFIVHEDNENYTLRKTLNSPEEIKIPRDEVETISTKTSAERLAPPSVYSSVFLMDGGIIDCRIVKESIRSIEVQPSGGESRIIPIKDILRIQYNTGYKEKKILLKTDGTRIEGFIMEENLDSYIYRTGLYSPEEFRIHKNDLKSILRR